MLTISKILSLYLLFLPPPSSQENQRKKGDNFHSFLHLSLSLLNTLACSQFPSSYHGRRRRRRRREGGEGELLPPSSDFYYSTFKYCLFLDIPFLERPTSQSVLPPFLTFLKYIYPYFQYG